MKEMSIEPDQQLRDLLTPLGAEGLVALYVDASDCDLFEAGVVRHLGSDVVALEAVGSNGQPEGLLYLPLREVRRAAYGTKYLGGIEFLRGKWPELARGAERRVTLEPVADDLANARALGWIVQVHCRESDVWAGFVLGVSSRWLHMAVVVEEGELDGYILLDVDEIERMEVGGPSQLAHEFLFQRRLGIEPVAMTTSPGSPVEASLPGEGQEVDMFTLLALLRREQKLAGVYRRGGEGGYRAGYVHAHDSATVVLDCLAPGGSQDGVVRMDLDAVLAVRWDSEYLRVLRTMHERGVFLAPNERTVAESETMLDCLAELAASRAIVTITERDGHQTTGRVVERDQHWIKIDSMRGGRHDGVFLLRAASLLSVRTGGVDELYEEACISEIEPW